MRSFLWTVLFFSTFLLGKETVEVFSEEIRSTANFFEATGDVLILYDGKMFKSEHATYDKKTSLLILTGNVEMLGDTVSKMRSKELKIDTSSKSVTFKKLLLTTEENLWIDAHTANKEDEEFSITNSRLSSCDTLNPDWTLQFSKALYAKDKNYMTLEDVKLQFFNQTLFYFPYLAFPTVTERTSGLLFPLFKFSNIEGFVYQQPYFLAPTNNIDIEINPQIRTNRGAGTHVTTRFVDSNHSSGLLTLGYFQNTDKFSRQNNLNSEHYGFEFLYNSTGFLEGTELGKEYKSGLYANVTYLNDLEYLNLQKSTASSLVSSNLIESRVNAFVYDENDYLGLYAKYYIDTSKVSNSETIQELPSLQYHRFMNFLFSKELYYTLDARVHHYTRLKGSTAYQTEFDLPITYYNTFFNDYLNFSLSENLYFTDVHFRNLDESSGDYRFYRNFHTMELSSDLIKRYGEDSHTLHPSIVYTRPSFEIENPLKYDGLHADQQELFVIQTQRENISFGLSQYYYNNNLDMTFFHRLAWLQFPHQEFNRGDVNNEFSYTDDDFSFYSNLFYSLDKNKIRSLTTSLSYNQSNYDIMLTHFYNNDLSTDTKLTSFIHGSVAYNYNQYNQLFASNDSDLENSFRHQWRVGWIHKQKCWGAKLSIGQERIPNVVSSFNNSMVYFELNLNPLGGISQNIEQEFSSQGR